MLEVSENDATVPGPNDATVPESEQYVRSEAAVEAGNDAAKVFGGDDYDPSLVDPGQAQELGIEMDSESWGDMPPGSAHRMVEAMGVARAADMGSENIGEMMVGMAGDVGDFDPELMLGFTNAMDGKDIAGIPPEAAEHMVEFFDDVSIEQQAGMMAALDPEMIGEYFTEGKLVGAVASWDPDAARLVDWDTAAVLIDAIINQLDPSDPDNKGTAIPSEVLAAIAGKLSPDAVREGEISPKDMTDIIKGFDGKDISENYNSGGAGAVIDTIDMGEVTDEVRIELIEKLGESSEESQRVDSEKLEEAIVGADPSHIGDMPQETVGNLVSGLDADQIADMPEEHKDELVKGAGADFIGSSTFEDSEAQQTSVDDSSTEIPAVLEEVAGKAADFFK